MLETTADALLANHGFAWLTAPQIGFTLLTISVLVVALAVVLLRSSKLGILPATTSQPPSKKQKFSDIPSSKSRQVAILWDLENCYPSGADAPEVVLQAIKDCAFELGSTIANFWAYLEIQPSERQHRLRVALSRAGVTIIECPHNGAKEVVDHAIIWDLAQVQSQAVLLVSGDKDFTRALNQLKLRGSITGVIGFGLHPPSLPADRVWHFPKGVPLANSEILSGRPSGTPGSDVLVKSEAHKSPTSKTGDDVISTDVSEYYPLFCLLNSHGATDAIPWQTLVFWMNGENCRLLHGYLFREWIRRGRDMGVLRLIDKGARRRVMRGIDHEMHLRNMNSNIIRTTVQPRPGSPLQPQWIAFDPLVRFISALTKYSISNGMHKSLGNFYYEIPAQSSQPDTKAPKRRKTHEALLQLAQSPSMDAYILKARDFGIILPGTTEGSFKLAPKYQSGEWCIGRSPLIIRGTDASILADLPSVQLQISEYTKRLDLVSKSPHHSQSPLQPSPSPARSPVLAVQSSNSIDVFGTFTPPAFSKLKSKPSKIAEPLIPSDSGSNEPSTGPHAVPIRPSQIIRAKRRGPSSDPSSVPPPFRSSPTPNGISPTFNAAVTGISSDSQTPKEDNVAQLKSSVIALPPMASVQTIEALNLESIRPIVQSSRPPNMPPLNQTNSMGSTSIRAASPSAFPSLSPSGDLDDHRVALLRALTIHSTPERPRVLSSPNSRALANLGLRLHSALETPFHRQMTSASVSVASQSSDQMDDDIE